MNAVIVTGCGGTVRIEAGRVIVAAGTYGSPAILMRSGVGDPSEFAPPASRIHLICLESAATCTTIHAFR